MVVIVIHTMTMDTATDRRMTGIAGETGTEVEVELQKGEIVIEAGRLLEVVTDGGEVGRQTVEMAVETDVIAFHPIDEISDHLTDQVAVVGLYYLSL